MNMGVASLVRRVRGMAQFRAVSLLVGGSAASQAVALAAAPLLSRIFLPSEYGYLALFMGISAALGPVSTLQYAQPIVYEKEEQNARALFSLSVAIAICISAITFAVATASAVVFSQGISHELQRSLPLLAISVLVTGCASALSAVLNRHRLYRQLATGRLLGSLVGLAATIALGLAGMGASGLIAGYLVGQLVPGVAFAITVLMMHAERPWGGVTLQQLRHAAISQKRFPLFVVPADFLFAFSNSLPTYLFSSFVGIPSVGLMSMANRVLGLPAGLTSGAISEVFRKEAAEAYAQTGSCDAIVRKTIVTTAVLAAPPFLIVAAASPTMFPILFGDRWAGSGVLAAVLAPMFYLRLVVSPVGSVFSIVGRQVEGLMFHIATVVLLPSVFGLWFMFVGRELLGAAALLSVFFVLRYLVLGARAMRVSSIQGGPDARAT